MPWCHLFLMMPLFGLAAFVFLPLAAALPLYLTISAISLLIYAKIMKAMHAPVATGREGMIGKEALVVSEVNPEGLINYRGELWKASSKEGFHPGERVRIVTVEGVRAVVEKLDEEASNDGDRCPSHC
jgi:membrane-bound serine protease (ClpP class)